jgi:hypothetical protein
MTNERTHLNQDIARAGWMTRSRWAGLMLAPLLGCVSNLQPLSVTHFYPITSVAGGCTAGTTLDVAVGLLDSSLADALNGKNPNFGAQIGYVTGVQLTSQLIANNLTAIVVPGMPTLRVDSNTAHIDTMTAKYRWSSTTGAFTTKTGTFPISVTLPPLGIASFPASLLSASDGAQLSGQTGTLAVEITFSGTLEDSSAISSTPATFSIDVCPGCVQSALPCTVASGLLRPICGPSATSQFDGLTCAKP